MCLRFSHARSDDLLIRLADYRLLLPTSSRYRLLLPSVLLLLIFMFLRFLFCSSIQLSHRTNWCLKVLNHGNKNIYTVSFLRFQFFSFCSLFVVIMISLIQMQNSIGNNLQKQAGRNFNETRDRSESKLYFQF